MFEAHGVASQIRSEAQPEPAEQRLDPTKAAGGPGASCTTGNAGAPAAAARDQIALRRQVFISTQ